MESEIILASCHCLFYGGLAQLARAPALQAGGQRFESVILHHSDADFSSSVRKEIFDILTHKTVSKDFKLKTELYISINSQFTAESMSNHAVCLLLYSIICSL